MTTDQPTSSLEEARDQLERCIIGNCPHAAPEVCIRRFEAAARAEVIREVEAQAEREHAIMWARTGRAWADAVEEDADLCRGRALRALSQGGEGKSDG